MFINVGMLLTILGIVTMLGLAMWLIYMGVHLFLRAYRKGGRSTRG